MNSISRIWNNIWAPHPPLYKELFMTYCAYVIFAVSVTPFFLTIAGKESPLHPAYNLPLYFLSWYILRYRNKKQKKLFLESAGNLGILRRINRFGMVLNIFFAFLSIGA